MADSSGIYERMTDKRILVFSLVAGLLPFTVYQGIVGIFFGAGFMMCSIIVLAIVRYIVGLHEDGRLIK